MAKFWFYSLLAVFILGIFLSACGGSSAIPNNEEVDPESEGLPPVAAVRAREELSDQLGIGIEEVAFVSFEQATWSDSCLGLGGPAESCLQAEVEGWLVELSVSDEIYKAHTDWLGEKVRFEP